MKICPKCNNSWTEDFKCCPICGIDLIENQEHLNVSMGNANAISGGVHTTDNHTKTDSDNITNSNNETHTNSHNTTTTNNTTIIEAAKSASEKHHDNIISYRIICKKLYNNGLISREGKSQLRELQLLYNLADELVLPIHEEISIESKKRRKQISAIANNDIRQTKSIIEQNTVSALNGQLVKLEALMQEFDVGPLKQVYYQMSSMLEPVCYTNRYECSAHDEYWEQYWAYVAYLLQNRIKQASEALASLGRWNLDYPEQNEVILQIIGKLMQNESLEDIREARKILTSNYTSDLRLILEAIDELLEKNWSVEYISIQPTHSFYINTLFREFVETQKQLGINKLKSLKEEKRKLKEQEDIKRHIEEIAQNEAIMAQAKADAEAKRLAAAKQEAENISKARELANQQYEIEMAAKARREEENRRREEAEKKIKEEKKTRFINLFESNSYNIQKTCFDVGISKEEYDTWNKTDLVFKNKISYYIQKRDAIRSEKNKVKRNNILKKLIPFIIGSIVIIILILLINKCNDNRKNEEIRKEEQAKINEELRIVQEKERTQKEHNDTINAFDSKITLIKKSNDIEKKVSYIENAYNILKEINQIEKSAYFKGNSKLIEYKTKLTLIIDTIIKNDNHNLKTMFGSDSYSKEIRYNADQRECKLENLLTLINEII